MQYWSINIFVKHQEGYGTFEIRSKWRLIGGARYANAYAYVRLYAMC